MATILCTKSWVVLLMSAPEYEVDRTTHRTRYISKAYMYTVAMWPLTYFHQNLVTWNMRPKTAEFEALPWHIFCAPQYKVDWTTSYCTFHLYTLCGPVTLTFYLFSQKLGYHTESWTFATILKFISLCVLKYAAIKCSFWPSFQATDVAMETVLCRLSWGSSL